MRRANATLAGWTLALGSAAVLGPVTAHASPIFAIRDRALASTAPALSLEIERGLVPFLTSTGSGPVARASLNSRVRGPLPAPRRGSIRPSSATPPAAPVPVLRPSSPVPLVLPPMTAEASRPVPAVEARSVTDSSRTVHPSSTAVEPSSAPDRRREAGLRTGELADLGAKTETPDSVPLAQGATLPGAADASLAPPAGSSTVAAGSVNDLSGPLSSAAPAPDAVAPGGTTSNSGTLASPTAGTTVSTGIARGAAAARAQVVADPAAASTGAAAPATSTAAAPSSAPDRASTTAPANTSTALAAPTSGAAPPLSTSGSATAAALTDPTASAPMTTPVASLPASSATSLPASTTTSATSVAAASGTGASRSPAGAAASSGGRSATSSGDLPDPAASGVSSRTGTTRPGVSDPAATSTAPAAPTAPAVPVAPTVASPPVAADPSDQAQLLGYLASRMPPIDRVARLDPFRLGAPVPAGLDPAVGTETVLAPDPVEMLDSAVEATEVVADSAPPPAPPVAARVASGLLPSPVPEPSTLGVFSLLLALAAAARRPRRRDFGSRAGR